MNERKACHGRADASQWNVHWPAVPSPFLCKNENSRMRQRIFYSPEFLSGMFL